MNLRLKKSIKQKKNYINSFFNSENISVLFERNINPYTIEEGISTNIETNKRNISAYAIASSEIVNDVELIDLEVRNNTQEQIQKES